MKYPNLQVIHNRAVSILTSDMSEKEKEEFRPQISMDAFLQTWPNTATGFARKGYAAGSAMTSEYTTVVYESCTDAYIVFFGEKPAYRVDGANKTFIDDLHYRRMKSVEAAMEAY